MAILPWARRAWSARSRRAAEGARCRGKGSRLAFTSLQPRPLDIASRASWVQANSSTQRSYGVTVSTVSESSDRVSNPRGTFCACCFDYSRLSHTAASKFETERLHDARRVARGPLTLQSRRNICGPRPCLSPCARHVARCATRTGAKICTTRVSPK